MITDILQVGIMSKIFKEEIMINIASVSLFQLFVIEMCFKVLTVNQATFVVLILSSFH